MSQTWFKIFVYILHIESHLTLRMILQDKFYYLPYFTEEEMGEFK